VSLVDKFRGCLLGLACGDAVGTTVEFKARGAFKPVIDMIGGGPFRLKAGEWTDDTSMALCLADSLIATGRFDPKDQMKRYCRWMDEGYLSSNGRCFDIGGTVRRALSRYKKTGEPFSGSTDPHSAGNGCIMRLAPIPMFFYPDRRAVIEMSGESSRTTHGAPECVEACRLFGGILYQVLTGAGKEDILLNHQVDRIMSNKIQAIAHGGYRTKNENQIRGSGYVAESLEAALWCFDRSGSFKEAILKAANLGDDADTTAAVCGQIAGAFYGEPGIPPKWLEKLALLETIRGMADSLFERSGKP
jgi:ADP-ribosyl-[dinitrogen reductase] hydrolase